MDPLAEFQFKMCPRWKEAPPKNTVKAFMALRHREMGPKRLIRRRVPNDILLY